MASNFINSRIKETAEYYIGQEELVSNSGFKDVTFLKKMKDVGWSKSLSWCAYFTELVWIEAYKSFYPKDYIKIVTKLTKLFSASATTTYKNFDLDKEYKTGKLPVIGTLAVWRYGVGWQGHIGVVVSVSSDNKTFHSVEGNTNSKGGREGVEVAKKLRKVDYTIKANSLNLIGFVYPN